MSSAPPPPPDPDEIARDATWLTQALDPVAGLVRLIQMDRAAYRAASFLDDRMLQAPAITCLVPWPSVSAAIMPGARRDARWIFHIGHVGSTLVARLLGELSAALAVREPRFLRDVAATVNRGEFTDAAQVLFSRTFAADEVALVKATSFVSEVAPELVPPAGRALFMYASPRSYVASILAGENSVKELHMLAPSRAERLAVRASETPPPRHEADLAAAAWACEMTALEAAACGMSDRAIHWADFDRMLEDMAPALVGIASELDLPATPAEIEAVVRGPLMGKYSKALEFDYTPALRRELIADATRRHGREIDDALAMLSAAAEKSPLLARALERSGEH